MSMSVEQIVEEIKTLSPEEQQRLLDQLAEEPASHIDAGGSVNDPEEEFKRRLLEAGIIKEIKRPRCDQKAQEEFLKYKPIRIQGKPISETIIEERR